MRSVGSMSRAQGYGCSDHVCWSYDTQDERDRVAIDWLFDGAKQGQRLVVVTTDCADRLRDSALNAPDAALLRENIFFFTTDDLYDLSQTIDPPAQLATYRGAVEQALADGFNGIRVFADITPLIADPARRPSHAAWEHYADAWMAQGNLLAPMCAYDRNVITDPPRAIISMHPLHHVEHSSRASFGLYWDPSGRILDGEINALGVPTLHEVLAALPNEPIDIDVSRLSFLNAGGATLLAQMRDVAAGQPPIRLVGAQPLVKRMWEILDLDPRMCL